MIVYNYDRDNREFLYESEAHPNPLEDGFLIPANATSIKPEDKGLSSQPIFNEELQEWEYVESHKRCGAHNLKTGEFFRIYEYGKLHEDLIPTYDLLIDEDDQGNKRFFRFYKATKESDLYQPDFKRIKTAEKIDELSKKLDENIKELEKTRWIVDEFIDEVEFSSISKREFKLIHKDVIDSRKKIRNNIKEIRKSMSILDKNI